MNVKFWVVALLLSFGLLQASDYKSTETKFWDKEIEMAKYAQEIEERIEEEKREQENKIESTTIGMQRKYIQRAIDYRDVLHARSQELSESNLTTDQLVKIGDNLLGYAKQNITIRLAEVDIYNYGDEYSYSSDLDNESYIDAIKSVREDLVFAQKQYNKEMRSDDFCTTFCCTCGCCGLCIIPVLVWYISFYKNPSRNEIQTKAAALKSAVDIKLGYYHTKIEIIAKKRPDLMSNISLEESTTSNVTATIPRAPEAVVVAFEMKS